jgi:hypothetical protein
MIKALFEIDYSMFVSSFLVDVEKYVRLYFRAFIVSLDSSDYLVGLGFNVTKLTLTA